MARLLFSPEADSQLTRLEADPRSSDCIGRIHSALDILEADAGDVRNRRRRLQTVELWGIAVFCRENEWLILWEPGIAEDVFVHHIVPVP